MKRSTMNIELLTKVLNYFYENIRKFDSKLTMNDLFTLIETFTIEGYKEKTFHLSPTMEDTYFSYCSDPGNSYIEVIDVLRDGRAINCKLEILSQDFNPVKMAELYNELCDDDLIPKDKYFTTDYGIVANLEDEKGSFLHRITNVAIYKGDIVNINKYKNKQEAIDTIRETLM